MLIILPKYSWEPNKCILYSGQVIYKFDTKKLEAKEFVKGINSFTVSADRSHVLYRKGSNWEIVGSKSPPKMGENNLKLNLNMGRLLAHEIGHALGANHDDGA